MVHQVVANEPVSRDSIEFRPKPHHRLAQLDANELRAEYQSANVAYREAIRAEDRYNAMALMRYSARVSDLLSRAGEAA